MASAGDSCEAMSEETFEYKCTAGCLRKNLVTEAVEACVDCKKYFCPACLEVHNSIIDNHNTVQPPVLCSAQPTTLPTEQCKKHVGKMIDVWCVQHDVVGCVSCALFDHRACEEMKDIPSEIDGIFKQNEFDQVKVELNNTLEHLKERQNLLVGEKEKLLVEKNAQISKIEQYTFKLISLIKALEENAKKDIYEKFKAFEDHVNKLADVCKQIEEDLKQCLDKVGAVVLHKPQMFIAMKQAQGALKLADTNCQAPVITKRFEFKPSSDTEKFLSGLQSLGTINVEPCQYKLKHKHEINVKMSDDTDDCDIEGSCLLPDGSVIVADYKNKKIKRVDISTSSVIDSCIVPGSPYGVCCIGHQELAVALSNGKIQFVTLGSRMTPSRTIDVEHYCYGIAYHNGELFVSDNSSTIYVYNMQGSLLRKLTNITTERCRYLVVSRDGEKVFSACSRGGLVCTDRHGRQIYTYKYENVGYCHGVCLDHRSSLFVCGYQSNNVVQVKENGEKVGEIVNKSDGLIKPQSMCFDPNRQKLVLGQLSNTVLVLELEID